MSGVSSPRDVCGGWSGDASCGASCSAVVNGSTRERADVLVSAPRPELDSRGGNNNTVFSCKPLEKEGDLLIPLVSAAMRV